LESPLEALIQTRVMWKKSKKGNSMTKSLFASLSKYMGALALLMMTSTAQAKTIKVTCDADPGPCNGTTLRQAVAEANNGDKIVFSSRVTSIILSAPIDIMTSITINGGSTVTIDGNNLTRLFTVDSDTTVTLTGLALQNGFSSQPGLAGAITTFGNLTVKGCVFTNNITNGDSGVGGGAIFNNAGGTLNIRDSTFSSNRALGAFTLGGAILSTSRMTVEDSSFFDNSSSFEGGAIAILTSATMITESTFTSNHVDSTTGGSGGAIFIDSTSTLAVNSSTFSSNFVSGTDSVGGAISNNGTLSVADSTLTNNMATTCCAIFNSPGSSFSNQNNTISGSCTGPNVCGP
jgi:hypothetical protein